MLPLPGQSSVCEQMELPLAEILDPGHSPLNSAPVSCPSGVHSIITAGRKKVCFTCLLKPATHIAALPLGAPSSASLLRSEKSPLL